jgi:hypothetical protein
MEPSVCSTLADFYGSGLVNVDPVELIGAGRLESIAALNNGGRLCKFVYRRQPGLSGCWFAHRILGFNTKIGEAALSLPDSNQISGLVAAECFMDASGADVARLTITGNDMDHTDPATQYQMGWGKSWHAGMSQTSHDILPLTRDAEAFLARLGRHTRRNVRRAERIADELGMDFMFENTASSESVRQLQRLAALNKPVPLRRRRVRAYEALIARKTGGFESRFRTAGGEVVSCCRGYIDGRVAYLVYQVNNPVIPRINLSALHRFKLIERLIGEGVTALVFPFGCEGLFQPACQVVALEERVAIRRSLRGAATAIAVMLMAPRSQLAAMIGGTLNAAFAWRMAHSRYGRALSPIFSGQIGGFGAVVLPARWERYAFGVLTGLFCLGVRVALQDSVSDGIDFGLDTEFM